MLDILSNLLFYIIKPFAVNVLKKGNYPQDAIERKCGIIPEEGFNTNEDVIMFHGVSVGEAVALENLIKKTREEFPNSKIVMTTGTWTGQDIAKKKLGDYVDLITYFPADFPCVIKKFLDKVNPSTIFIAETEIWPFFAKECKKRNINLFIINGRISDSTFNLYNSFKFIFKYFLNFYTGIYTQSEDDNQKFLKLGAAQKTTKVMNNLKFDIKPPIVDFEFNKNNYKVLLAGSTHAGEDEIVLNVYKKLKENFSDLKLILAPRHLNRVESILELIKTYNFDYELRSNGKKDLENIDILVLNTLGELGKMYKFSDVSFIGGSFNKTGGHNPLESIVFQKPVISGPSTHNFKDIYNIIKKANAGFIVNSQDDFYEILYKMFEDKDHYDNIVQNSISVFESQQGALEFVINVIKTLRKS